MIVSYTLSPDTIPFASEEDEVLCLTTCLLYVYYMFLYVFITTLASPPGPLYTTYAVFVIWACRSLESERIVCLAYHNDSCVVLGKPITFPEPHFP